MSLGYAKGKQFNASLSQYNEIGGLWSTGKCSIIIIKPHRVCIFSQLLSRYERYKTDRHHYESSSKTGLNTNNCDSFATK